ncbi:uncharacterized protein CMC5_023350 [Chondromyces crocatus]|uniref:Uncharacterized protein n=1 Tax=Chondromyces crocatus TaxID=52 RepID=A0A0K1EBY8_CHOCO|nr:uncharacterized protein CMC5_023350 [Chondromyces crocatus]
MTSKNKGFSWWILFFPAIFVTVFVAFRASEKNIATNADGEPAIAEITRAPDGSCVGVKGSACYALHLPCILPRKSPSPPSST